MKVKYTFANGEVVEVEVDAMWEAELKELDRLEHNNDQTETRRHCTLNVLGDEGEWLSCDAVDPANILEKKEFADNISGVLDKLTVKQRDAIERIHLEGMSITAYAKLNGISQQVAAKRLYAAEKKFRFFFKSRV